MKLPNSTVINDTKVGYLPLSNLLSTAAKKVRILKDLTSASLISIGQLADDGCTTTIDPNHLTVKKNGKVILTGTRNTDDNLYDIPIFQDHPNPKTNITPDNFVMPPLTGIHNASSCQNTVKPSVHVATQPQVFSKKKHTTYDINHISPKCFTSVITPYIHQNQKLNVILRKQQKHSDLAEFLHGCGGSPVPSTFITAIKNNQYLSWPGLTSDLIRKHLPPNRATTKGHLHQESQHLQSTKPADYDTYIKNIKNNIARLQGKIKNPNIELQLKKDIESDAFPDSPSPNVKANQVVYLVCSSAPKDMGYIDLTGRFPYRSASGNQYILVAYHQDANAIYGQPIKNRESASITAAWTTINDKFRTSGVQPKTYVIDNEASMELKIL